MTEQELKKLRTWEALAKVLPVFAVQPKTYDELETTLEDAISSTTIPDNQKFLQYYYSSQTLSEAAQIVQSKIQRFFTFFFVPY